MMNRPIVCDRKRCGNRGDCDTFRKRTESWRLSFPHTVLLIFRTETMSMPRLTIRLFVFLAAFLLMGAASARADGPSASPEKEAELLAVLRSDAPGAEKAIACKLLAIHGSSEAVPDLARLLPDAQLASWARIALEAIPGTAADEALRKATDSLHGKLLVGTINSIGVRRDVNSVDPLVTRLDDADAEVASAAAVALGRIGNAAAAKSLRRALTSAPVKVRSAVAEGCVLCAERSVSEGRAAEAAEIYDEVRKADVPRQRVLEATRGAILTRKDKGLALLIEQFHSPDKDLFQIALSTAREFPGREVDGVLASEMVRATPERAALLIEAMADRQETVVLSAVLKAAEAGPKQVRMAAIGALGRVGDAACLSPLLGMALESDADLSQSAKSALAVLPDGKVEAEIVARLVKAGGAMYPLLIEIVGKRRIEEAMPALLKAVDNSDEAVRSAGLIALGETVALPGLPVLIKQAVTPKYPVDAAVAHQALRAACIRMPDREACAEAIVKAMERIDRPSEDGPSANPRRHWRNQSPGGGGSGGEERRSEASGRQHQTAWRVGDGGCRAGFAGSDEDGSGGKIPSPGPERLHPHRQQIRHARARPHRDVQDCAGGRETAGRSEEGAGRAQEVSERGKPQAGRQRHRDSRDQGRRHRRHTGDCSEGRPQIGGGARIALQGRFRQSEARNRQSRIRRRDHAEGCDRRAPETGGRVARDRPAVRNVQRQFWGRPVAGRGETTEDSVQDERQDRRGVVQGRWFHHPSDAQVGKAPVDPKFLRLCPRDRPATRGMCVACNGCLESRPEQKWKFPLVDSDPGSASPVRSAGPGLRIPLFIGAFCSLLVIGAVIGESIYARHHLRNLELACEKISHWAREQALEPGAHPRLQIPTSLSLPRGSEVNVVRSARGDIVVLLKTHIGWKGNYEGVLYSTSPIGEGEISIDGFGREEIAVPGIDVNAPVIKNCINPQFFRVYFDLG